MKKSIVSFIVTIACAYCFAQEPPINSPDSIKTWVKEIQDKCAGINGDTAKLKVVQKDIFDQSSEGGFLRSYYDGNTLRKAILTLFGEAGQSTTEYYLSDGDLIFSYERGLTYKVPLFMGKTEIKSKDEDRYYFKNQKLFHWTNTAGKPVRTESYTEKEKEILDEFKKNQ